VCKNDKGVSYRAYIILFLVPMLLSVSVIVGLSGIERDISRPVSHERCLRVCRTFTLWSKYVLTYMTPYKFKFILFEYGKKLSWTIHWTLSSDFYRRYKGGICLFEHIRYHCGQVKNVLNSQFVWPSVTEGQRVLRKNSCIGVVAIPVS
jgi:hypothetical protein